MDKQPYSGNGARVGAYTRVSTAMQVDDGFSLEAQRDLLQRYADERGWVIAGWYVDEGVSGTTLARPELQRLMADCADGGLDVVLIHRLDRMSRSLVGTRQIIDRLQAGGVAVISISENWDFTTPIGKMQLHIMATLAEYYVDNLRGEIRKGKRQRAASGFHNGQLSWGYTTKQRLAARLAELGECEHEQRHRIQAALEAYAEASKTLAIPDPDTAEGVRLAFNLYVNKRLSARKIALALNDAGYRNTARRGSGFITADMVSDLLSNRFYIGETSYGRRVAGHERQWLAGAHEPLVTAELFEAAQEVKRVNMRRKTQRREKYRVYPLSGVLRCADCGRAMSGWPVHGVACYRDVRRDLHDEPCTARKKTVKAADLEARVGRLLHKFKLPDDWRARALTELGRPMAAARPDPDDETQERLRRLKDLYLRGDVTLAEYDAERARLIPPAPEAGLTAAAFEYAAALLANIGALWDVANASERGQIIHALFNAIYARNGEPIAAELTPAATALLQKSVARTGRTGILPTYATRFRLFPAGTGVDEAVLKLSA
jgi:DNA invertase Pin-like site-specific DNA recombinase